MTWPHPRSDQATERTIAYYILIITAAPAVTDNNLFIQLPPYVNKQR